MASWETKLGRNTRGGSGRATKVTCGGAGGITSHKVHAVNVLFTNQLHERPVQAPVRSHPVTPLLHIECNRYLQTVAERVLRRETQECRSPRGIEIPRPADQAAACPLIRHPGVSCLHPVTAQPYHTQADVPAPRLTKEAKNDWSSAPNSSFSPPGPSPPPESSATCTTSQSPSPA